MMVIRTFVHKENDVERVNKDLLGKLEKTKRRWVESTERTKKLVKTYSESRMRKALKLEARGKISNVTSIKI